MTTRTSRAAAARALLTTTSTAALGLATLAATFALAAPALAQSSGTTPAAYKNVDDNGVDLTTGQFDFSLVEGSIGSGEGALALIRYGVGSTSLDNWAGMFLSQETVGGVTSMSLSLGNRSESFVADASGGYTPRQANGATLTGSGNSFTYRSSDGTEVAFGPPVVEAYPGEFPFCDGSPYASCRLPALSITEPSGKTVSLSWEVLTKCQRPASPDDPPLPCQYFWRLAGVANNLGYAMTIAYQPGGVVNGQASPAWFKRASVTFGNTAVANGPTRTVSYDFSAPGVTRITDAGGRVWQLTSGSGTLGIRRPGAASDSTTVVSGANGVSQVTRDGIATSYSRTVSGSAATMVVTDALGHSRTVVSNLAIGRPTQVTDEVGRTTLFGYDGNGRLTSVTAPEGNQLLTAYDARGNVTASERKGKPGSGASDLISSAGYDAACANQATCNQPNWTRDAGSNQTDYTYDTAGHVTSVTAPAQPNGVRPQTRYGYAGIAAPGGGSVTMPVEVSACRTGTACAGAADEVRATIGYANSNLLPSQVSTGAGDGSLTAVTQMGYDAIGDLVTVDGPLPGPADTTRTLYNASREVVGVIGPDPDGAGPMKHRAVRTTIDGQGQAVAQESGTVADQSDAAWAAFASIEQANAVYDANGRVVKRTLTSGGTAHGAVEYSYDAEGRPLCTAQRMNLAALGGLGDACSLTQEGTSGPDRISRTVYDAADRVVASEVAVGTPEQATEANATYTANGVLATLTDGENNRTTYAYDGHDRLVRTFYPVAAKGANASSTTDYEELGYDNRGNVVSRRIRAGGMLYYGYDALSRLVAYDRLGSEPDVSYTYDNLSNLTRALDMYGHKAEFAYDALGRKLSEGNYWYTSNYAYDLAGRRTRMTWSDGVFVGYDYLVTGEMTAIRENGAGSGVGVLATFAYDDQGRRTSLTRGNGTSTSYAFDPVSRLASLGQNFANTTNNLSLTFAYNPAGQITSNTRSNDAYSWTGHGSGTSNYTANGLNQYVQAGAASPTYDTLGNLSSDGAGRTFVHDSDSRLVIAGGSRLFYYEPLGRSVHPADNGIHNAYDGPDLITEHASVSGFPVLRRYVHGPGVDEPLVWYEGAGTSDRRFLHADERGSIVAVSDSAGNTIGTNKYDEYGAPAATNIGRFQYTGQRWLLNVQLYDYKARMYDPKLGFLEPDPIGYRDGANRYGYVGSDPINFVDPTGLCKDDGSPSDPGEDCREIVVTCCKSKDKGWGLDFSLTLPSAASLGGILINPFAKRKGPKPPRNPPKDYCGSGGTKFIPDRVGGTDISGPCAAHDACYASSSSQLDCDDQLRKDIIGECRRAPGGDGCYIAAYTYYFALRGLGSFAYNRTQEARRVQIQRRRP